MNGAVIVAAGQSTRMGDADKVLTPLAGRPLLAWSLDAFARTDSVDAIVVVASSGNREAIVALTRDMVKVHGVVLGGERRRDSVHAGLVTLADCEYVIVHDGARPLVTPDLIEAALAGADETGAAICAVPITDTVKRDNGHGFVRGTVSREQLWLAQTPQAFRLDLLLRAHAEVEGDLTDDAAMVEHLGAPVGLVQGSARNIKVTTPEDLELAAALLAAAH